MFRRSLPLLVALAATGCSQNAQLVAEDGSHRLKGYDPNSGVSVVLTTEAWNDREALEEEITIVHMLIANMGKERVLLAPGDFVLTDRRGFRYELLDAGGTFAAVPEGVDPDNVEVHGYDPGRSNEFRSISSTSVKLSQSALPWGVLEPGTQMRGFVYFEQVVDAANAATLVWYAQSPKHEPVANFAFKLFVAD